MTTSLLITCIMPTASRRLFVPLAIGHFLQQDYSERELVIVDDGTDAVEDLVPEDPRIRYVQVASGLTLGAKRNRACELAGGEIIVHWDDDDWYPPDRVSRQVEALITRDADCCGSSRVYYRDPARGRAWEYAYERAGRPWLAGNTLAYRRPAWERNRFREVQVGEDWLFVSSLAANRIADLCDPSLCVAAIHPGNTSRKRPAGRYWRPIDPGLVDRVVGEAGSGSTAARPAPDPATHERSIDMLTVAKQDDLTMPEYAALNHGLAFPWMRRWEIPFALTQARLTNTAAVLDCTINPAGFQERLSRLYPHVLYRHWSPVQNGQFALPLGVPDGAFDRVICINTLEHLLRSQRELLIEAMARKLKPGGWLVLTSDYYFDSSWEQPAFLQAGVMRGDRSEIFNGWNKVTPGEWLELCGRHDLTPLGDTVEEPRENDATLYRQQQPHPHACVGGVFGKKPLAGPPVGKKIVLALLTWNTRDVTIDSVQAHLREARMLRRLGHEPILCVCDNGSTDGLADGLRAVEPQIDIPHTFILNPSNFGNSIARNQIIDFMLESDADYLLMMDGDIEIVPFSSFAMLRYLENNGRRLGCIGADSSGQTPRRERASRYLYSVDGCRIETTNLVAWTQYGMFRRAVFEEGIRFDETKPFDGSGWGFEDNDLAFQMDVKGYLNHRFMGMTYLHRDARSSLRIMRERGIDVVTLYDQRKKYVIDKWAGVPQINGGPLTLLRKVSM